MNVLLKWWKRIKGIRRIWISATIIIAVVSAYLTFSRVLVHAGVRDPKDAGVGFELQDGSIATSGSVQALLESCEKIAKYMNDNGYSYDDSASRTPDRYDGPGDGSCCAAYVCWCLHDANIIKGQEHYCNVCGDHDEQSFTKDSVPGDGVWRLLYDDPDWVQVIAKSVDDLKPGDIQIYKTGASHTNIYAGKGEYWDAGSGSKGAFKGETRTSGYTIGNPGGDNGYTCTYRHKSMM